MYEDTPKTESSDRIVSISNSVMKMLREFKEEQDRTKAIMGEAWEEHNKLFTPTKWLAKFCKDNGLSLTKSPPISNASDSFNNARESNSHCTVVKENGRMLLIYHSVKEKESVSNEMNSQIVYTTYQYGYNMATPVPQKIKHTSKVTEKNQWDG